MHSSKINMEKKPQNTDNVTELKKLLRKLHANFKKQYIQTKNEIQWELKKELFLKKPTLNNKSNFIKYRLYT